ncbi:MAG: hypothetical protein CMI36_07375 [Owenweeksia sp.]|nr:hypothetical protein [Owenweeksia sp.]MBF98794.1 hypothetical protein [Owenweeksia sp.]HCQ16183.1 hypothetical protein [Cryomorphaceae bacterium]|tara:strand:+ start:10993 stop:12753 length:1761 start_codon:yes stop_codon:yes gene_type:complete
MQRILLVILLAFNALLVQAQVSFKANANRTTVGKNEQFTVEFKANSKGNNFQAPSFEGFRVLGGPNTSVSSYMDNYGMRFNVSYSYVLQPREVGTYEIGPASMEIDGETYRTQPLTITVEQSSPRANDPDDPYSVAASNAFLRVITSKTSVYQGEPLVASYKLYFKTNISRPELLDEPDFTGFYKDNVDLKRIDTEQDMYQGERYTTGIIRQVVLIPQRSGSIRPGLVEVKIPTQVPSNRRDFFGRRVTQTINQTASENFPTINVKPLPEAGKPSGFAGAVGRYTMDVSLSRNELSANESVTLKITIKGEGNLKLLDVPTPEIPNAFEAYDPKFSEKINVGAYGMNGSKTFEYLLIPRYGGTYKIPPVEFSYFDPRTERYETIRSEEFEVKVSGAPAQPGQTNGGIAASPQEDVNFLGKDILYIKTNPGNLQRAGESFLGSVFFYGILGGIGLSMAGMLVFFFAVSNRQTDIAKVRQTKAGKVARKHLKEAHQQLQTNDKDAFYNALSTALWGYFSDRFNIPQSKMSKDTIREELLTCNIDESLAARTIDMMNRAELARFTSAGVSDPRSDYDETARLITEIEGKL